MYLPIQSPPTPEQIPGYELTGEYREIQYGDEYWTRFDTLAVAGMLHPGNRWILRKKAKTSKPEVLPLDPSILALKPSPTDIQNTIDNKQYSAWICSDEFRVPVKGDVFWSHHLGYVCVSEGQHTSGYEPDRRWILKTPPTLIAALPPPPQAWLDKHQVKLTGEYRHAKRDELVAKMLNKRSYADLDEYGPWRMPKRRSTDPRWILVSRKAKPTKYTTAVDLTRSDLVGKKVVIRDGRTIKVTKCDLRYQGRQDRVQIFLDDGHSLHLYTNGKDPFDYNGNPSRYDIIMVEL